LIGFQTKIELISSLRQVFFCNWCTA